MILRLIWRKLHFSRPNIGRVRLFSAIFLNGMVFPDFRRKYAFDWICYEMQSWSTRKMHSFAYKHLFVTRISTIFAISGGISGFSHFAASASVSGRNSFNEMFITFKNAQFLFFIFFLRPTVAEIRNIWILPFFGLFGLYKRFDRKKFLTKLS